MSDDFPEPSGLDRDQQISAFAVELNNLVDRYRHECPDLTMNDLIASLDNEKYCLQQEANCDYCIDFDSDSNLLDEDEQDNDGDEWKG